MHEMEAGVRMSMSLQRKRNAWSSLQKAVPFVAIIFLVGAGVIQIGQSMPSEALDRYHADIAKQISEFPYQIGRWVGQDVVIPTSAQEILQPNGLISRRFTRYGENGALTFALIHCVDLRDMDGHHPPRCYPASGWSINQKYPTGDSETIDVRIGDLRTEMSVYRFKQGGPIESGNELTVVSVFVTPMAGMVNDMAVLQDLGSMGRGASSLGVGQLQLVMSGDVERSDLKKMVDDFISNIPTDLIRNMMSFPDTEELRDLRNYTFDESGRS
ncbi:MAG: hypothetical protein CMJ33_09985 [Phycisphaerae bacterium]|nr:hypothetical protein [Phycisphaerae bacterium]